MAVRVAFIVGLLALAGCATPYQEMGILGGVTANRVSGDTAQIVANGNAYTDQATIQRYALRRAAEETVGDGFDLFEIGQSNDTTRVGAETFGSATATRRGIVASSFTMPVIKPGTVILIRMLKGPAPDPMPPGEFDAHAVLRYTVVGRVDHRDCRTVDGKVVCQ